MEERWITKNGRRILVEGNWYRVSPEVKFARAFAKAVKSGMRIGDPALDAFVEGARSLAEAVKASPTSILRPSDLLELIEAVFTLEYGDDRK